MTLTDHTDFIDSQLDAGIAARNAGELVRAKAIFCEVLHAVGNDYTKGKAIALSELGYIARCQKQLDEAREWLAACVQVSPRFELGSVQLFFTLLELKQVTQALEESVRFLRLRNSTHYREIFAEGVREGLDDVQQSLADEARILLARFV